MINTSANFDTYNALAHKNPVWIVEFDGISDKFCSQAFSGITSSYKKYLKDFFVEPIQIDLETLAHTFGGYQFKIVDKDSEITTIIKDNDIVNLKIIIKYGFQELTINDFMDLPYAYITNWQVEEDLLSFQFNSRVLNKELDSPPFRSPNVTTLIAGITDTATTINLTSDPGFNDPGYIQIEDEYIYYGSIVGTQLQSCTRGYAGSEAKAHNSGILVYAGWLFNYTCGSFIMNMLANTDAGTNGLFDLGIIGFGANIDDSLIDQNDVMNEDWKYGHNVLSPKQMFYYFFTKEDESIHNLIEDILIGAPAILRFNNSKLSIQYFDYDIFDYYVESIDDNDFKVNSYKQENISNIIRSQTKKYNQGPFQNDEKVKLAESITKYSASKVLNVNSPQAWEQKVASSGVITEAGDDLGQAIIMRRFMRFGQENFILDINTRFRKIIWEVGDVLRITSNYIPDFEGGGRGIANKNFMIHEKSVNLDGTLNFKLFGFREPLDKLSIATINRIQYASIDHPGGGYMLYNSDHAANNYQAASDAKYDNPSSYEAHVVRFDFECESQGAGSPGETNQFIFFDLMLQSPISTNVINRTVSCYFDATDNYTFKPSFYVYNFDGDGILQSQVFDRIRADWYFISTGTASDIKVKLNKIVFIKFNVTIVKLT